MPGFWGHMEQITRAFLTQELENLLVVAHGAPQTRPVDEGALES